MDLRLVLGSHPSLIIIESLIGQNIFLGASTGSIIIGSSTATTFKGIDHGEATSTGAAPSSTVTDHDSYIEVRKAP